MLKLRLPSGEEIELYDELLERALGILGAERSALVDALYALYKDRSPQTMRETEKVLKFHRRI